jgi:hypothetical protein
MMTQNVLTQWCRWSILVLILGLSGCGGDDAGLTPEMIATQYNITQDQLNQWNANNEVNSNPPQIADLTIVGCVSSV